MHSTQAPPLLRNLPDFFFAGAEREAICQALILDLRAGRRLLCLAGESGSGKTLLCRVLMERLPDNWIPVYLENAAASAEALFRQVCINLGAGGDSKSPDFTWSREFERRILAQRDAGRRVLLILDPAEDPRFAAPLDLLFRRCPAPAPGGEAPLAALLTGADPEPMLRQLAVLDAGHRPDKTYELGPMTLEETGEYLRRLLRVSGLSPAEGDDLPARMDAAAVFAQAAGNYRKTNLVAAEALADIVPAHPAPAPSARRSGPDRRPRTPADRPAAAAPPAHARLGRRRGARPRGLAWKAAERVLLRLSTQLMANKRMTAGLFALACFFCVLGLALKQGQGPPPDTPATAAETELAARLKEYRAASAALVAASYRGARTIRLAAASGEDAAARMSAFADHPALEALKRESGGLYLVTREAGPDGPAAACLFHGIFPNADEARHALEALPEDLPARQEAHSLPAAEALRCDVR